MWLKYLTILRLNKEDYPDNVGEPDPTNSKALRAELKFSDKEKIWLDTVLSCPESSLPFLMSSQSPHGIHITPFNK